MSDSYVSPAELSALSDGDTATGKQAVTSEPGVAQHHDGLPVRPVERTASRFPLLTREELRDLPPAEWLIAGILPEASLALLYGMWATLKSFLALDFMLSIASGRDWQQRQTKQGSVVYLVGEGVRGLPNRIDAWERRHGPVPSGSFHTVPLAANLLRGDEADRLERTLADVQDLRLIVFDTYARHMPGGDENGPRDSGTVIAAIDRLRQNHNATALVIHHSGKDESKGERGHTSLPGAADVRMRLTRKGMSLSLTCTKMKDDEEFQRVMLSAEKELDSLVLVSHDGAGPLTDSERAVLAAVPVLPTNISHSYAVLAEHAGTVKSSAGRAVKSLLERGLLQRDVRHGKTVISLPDEAQRPSVPARPTPSSGSLERVPSHPTTLQGGTTDRDRASNDAASTDLRETPGSNAANDGRWSPT